jgi:hypothetical protein
MPLGHLTQHGTRRTGDALDLMLEQNEVLRALFVQWSRIEVTPSDPVQAVPANWDRGTVGKLILEHAAVWFAARQDLARVLHDIGATDAADQLADSSGQLRRLLDRLHDVSAGVQPMSLATGPGFVVLIEEFRDSLRNPLAEEMAWGPRLERLLGDDRGRLRRAKFLRKHAPTHPGRRSWREKVPVLTRLHTIYDRLRGIPWAENDPQANTRLARRYDRE